jgi:DeoR/GlpR family transcriptional regulator of sugar metabolism
VIAAQRRRAILRQIEVDGYAEASRLSAEFAVDVSTIRRDLDSLARSGLVQRTHGGALRAGAPGALGLTEKRPGFEHGEAERAIARLAAGLVSDGEAVALDAGATTHALALALAGRKNLTVVTNDLAIAHDLAAWRRGRLVVVGGELAETGTALVGPWTQDDLARFHTDWAFLAADGIDAEVGATTDDTGDVPVKRAMLAGARATALVAPSARFGHHALATFARLDEFDRLITDDGLAATARPAYGAALVCAAHDDVRPDTD